MNIKWKILSPHDFFNQMSPSKFKIDNGIVKPRSFEGIMWLYILEEIIYFETEVDRCDKINAITSSLIACIKIKFDADFFVAELKKNIKIVQKKHIEKKVLLALLSIEFPGDIEEINFFDTRINFYKNEYPSLYYTLTPRLHNLTSTEEKHYTKISLTQSTHLNEIEPLLRNLNIFRAILCVHSNDYMVMGHNYYEPINLIRLGKNYCLYSEKELIQWGNQGEYKYFPKKTAHIKGEMQNVIEMIKRIESIQNKNYKNIIKESLLIYVNALDDYDSNTALSLLWNSLDKLSNSSKGNYDQVLKRVASIGMNYSYDKILLENIKNIRNDYVHQGIENSRAKIFCYQLQYYFKELLQFHLDNLNLFSDIQEANEFLTYISKLNELKGDNKNYLLVKKALPHQKGLIIKGNL